MKISKMLKNRGLSPFRRNQDLEGWELLTESVQSINGQEDKQKKTRRKVKEPSEGFHSSRFRCLHDYV